MSEEEIEVYEPPPRVPDSELPKVSHPDLDRCGKWAMTKIGPFDERRAVVELHMEKCTHREEKRVVVETTPGEGEEVMQMTPMAWEDSTVQVIFPWVPDDEATMAQNKASMQEAALSALSGAVSTLALSMG